jgi:type II secretory pathway pseudopilin PulG
MNAPERLASPSPSPRLRLAFAMSSPYAAARLPRPRAPRGLTFIEVAIAASILAIAGVAALEVLASSDAAGRFARRQAQAAVEAERALSLAADHIKTGRAIPDAETLSAGLVGEALDGCTMAITAADMNVRLMIPGASRDAGPREIDLAVRNLVVEVHGPDDEVIVRFERAVPLPNGGG